MRTQTIEFDFAGRKLLLSVDTRLFTPTLTTSILLEHVRQEGVLDRSVLDLGCGVGPLSIWMALAGARRVDAVDLMPDACSLASENARLNDVDARIAFLTGDLFEPVRGRTYDVIVDDVSGVSEVAARMSSWFPPGVPAGGDDGTLHTVRMLRESRDYLNRGGFLLFPVLGLSRRARVLDTARRVYGDGLALLSSKRIPFNAELKGNMRRMEELRNEGLIEFDQVRSRVFWTLEVYKATNRG